MNKAALLRKIQELCFQKTESELFLDTHPDCRGALDFYKRTVAELDTALAEYNNKYAPLSADAVVGDRWTWIDTPWPWQMENGEDGRKGGGQ